MNSNQNGGDIIDIANFRANEEIFESVRFHWEDNYGVYVCLDIDANLWTFIADGPPRSVNQSKYLLCMTDNILSAADINQISFQFIKITNSIRQIKLITEPNMDAKPHRPVTDGIYDHEIK